MRDNVLPADVDTIVVGGGPAGCAVAAELIEHSDESVLLLEAGPDYGPYADGGWPAELLEAFDLAETHGWGYDSASTYTDRVVSFSRARVLGGCSSHNGCAAIWGHRQDYDDWAALGNSGWDTESLLPFFLRANEKMRVRIPDEQEVTPFHQLMLDSARAAGIPIIRDLNDLDESIGMAPSPANIKDGIRWNSAFAFLDDIRDRSQLTIAGDVLVDRLVFDGPRATGVVAIWHGHEITIQARRVVLTAGTYNSPQLLLRSGIGNPRSLESVGIKPLIGLKGVGQNLHDHPAIYLIYRGSDALKSQMLTWGETSWLPEEQTIAKVRSRYCDGAFDLHIYPECGPYADNRTAWDFTIPVACMNPQARGSLTIRTPDPFALPVIEHNYLGDETGHDRGVIVDGIQIAREIAANANRTGLLGDELEPGPDVTSETDLCAWVSNNVHHYFHAAGTCKMGPDSDSAAVVDDRGRVRGTDNVYVADCSIMPQVPRANTNIPAVVVGMRIGRWLADPTS
jgi:choline dehydrogenase